MQILVTGAAGFIGSFLSGILARQGIEVFGLDSLNDYYDINLKKARLQANGISSVVPGECCTSTIYPNYCFQAADLCNQEELEHIFRTHSFDCVVNLAAQAGVRYSLTNPDSYIRNNISGFMNLLEMCRKYKPQKLVYASSSSVYGNTSKTPFREDGRTDQPVSLYAATKKSNELMAYTYSQLYKLPTIGLRFFTVYGPFGRPDMAPMKFANAIRKGEPIQVFNNGNLARDFTFIHDIIDGIVKIVTTPGLVREDQPGIPAVIYNIGHGSPVKLMDFIRILEENLGQTACKEFIGMQAGDVYETWADTTKLKEDYNYTPPTSLEEGVLLFAQWFKTYCPSS